MLSRGGQAPTAPLGRQRGARARQDCRAGESMIGASQGQPTSAQAAEAGGGGVRAGVYERPQRAAGGGEAGSVHGDRASVAHQTDGGLAAGVTATVKGTECSEAAHPPSVERGNGDSPDQVAQRASPPPPDGSLQTVLGVRRPSPVQPVQPVLDSPASLGAD